MALPGPGDRGEGNMRRRRKAAARARARARLKRLSKGQLNKSTGHKRHKTVTRAGHGRPSTATTQTKKRRKVYKKSKKLRAKRAQAKSTKRAQQRMNQTYRRLKKKNKKNRARIQKQGTFRAPSRGSSVAKKKKPKKKTVKLSKIIKQNRARKKKAAAAKKKKTAAKRKYPGSLTTKTKTSLKKQSSSVAKEQYLPALQEISRQMRAVTRERDRNVGVQTAFGEKGDQRLADAGGWLDQVLQRQAGVTQDIYQKANQNVETAYAGAQASNQAAGETTLAGMGQSAEQLGLQEALNDPTSQLKAEILASQAEVDGDYAEARGNLETLGAEESARAQGTVSIAARQSAQDRSDLQTQVASGIAGIQRQAGEQLAEGQYAKRDIQSQRGLSQKNLYTQLRNETLDRKRQRWMDLLYRDVQKNTMKLQNAQLNLERSAQKSNQKIAKGQLNLARKTQKQGQKNVTREFRFNKNMALRQLRNEQAAIQAEIASANSPAARMQARLELEKVRADINYVNARTAAQLAKAHKFKSKRGKKKGKRWRSPVLPGPGDRPGGR